MYAKHFTLTLAAVLCGLGLALPVYAEPIVLTPSFEHAIDRAPGLGNIPGWIAEPAEYPDENFFLPLSGTNKAFNQWFFDNGVCPDGEYVACMETYAAWGADTTSLSQAISGFEVGQVYEVHFFVNARDHHGNPDMEVYIDNDLMLGPETIYPVEGRGSYTQPFHEKSFEFQATSETHTLKFTALLGSDGSDGDDSLLLDNVSISRAFLTLNWDGADANWGDGAGTDSHWNGGNPGDVPDSDTVANIDAAGSVCTVPAGTTAQTNTLDVGPAATLIVDGTLIAGSRLTTDPDSTLGGSGTITADMVMIDGAVAPGNSIGVLTLDAPVDGSELTDSAAYRCEIGADDAPIANDVIIAQAGDFVLGGNLELVATSKLRGPDETGEWFGEQTRLITNAVGDNSVLYSFVTTPTTLPADFGAAEWGEGHIGRGVFLTRDNGGGENDVPGVSYGPDGTDVHLFQALDGDTNGNAILDTADIFSILGAGSFLKPGEWDWTEGDFDGDKDVDTTDIFAILATGKWGNFAPYYPEPGKGSAVKGDCDAVVELIVNAATGEVSVDTNGAAITGYVISSDSGALTGEAATQFALSEQTSGQIADLLPLGKAFAGVHDLGNVLQGDGNDLTLTYTLAGQAGVFQGSVKVVPEPGTLVMLLGGAMSLLVVRRRRSD